MGHRSFWCGKDTEQQLKSDVCGYCRRIDFSFSVECKLWVHLLDIHCLYRQGPDAEEITPQKFKWKKNQDQKTMKENYGDGMN